MTATFTTYAPATLTHTSCGNPVTPQHVLHATHLWGQENTDQDAIDCVADYSAERGCLPKCVDDVIAFIDGECPYDGYSQTVASDDEAVAIATRAALLQTPTPKPVPTPTSAPAPVQQRPTTPAYGDLQQMARKLLKAGNMASLRAGCDRIGLDADRSDPVAMDTALEAFCGKPEAKPVNAVRERKVEPARPGQVKQQQRFQESLNHLDATMRLIVESNVGGLVLMTRLQQCYADVKRLHTELTVRMGTGPVADAKAAQSRTDTMNAKPAPAINANVAHNSPAANPVDPTPSPKPTIVAPKPAPKAATPKRDGLAQYRELVQRCKVAGVSCMGKNAELEARLARHATTTAKADAKVTEAASRQPKPTTKSPTPTPVAATTAKTVSVEVPTDREALIRKLLAMSDSDFAVVAGACK